MRNECSCKGRKQSGGIKHAFPARTVRHPLTVTRKGSDFIITFMLARTRKLDCEPRAPFLHSFVRSVRVDTRLVEYATLEMRDVNSSGIISAYCAPSSSRCASKRNANITVENNGASVFAGRIFVAVDTVSATVIPSLFRRAYAYTSV